MTKEPLWMKLTQSHYPPKSTINCENLINQPIAEFKNLLSGYSIMSKTESDYLIPVFPPRHPHHKIIYWDKTCNQYYNKSNDIYLCDDDVAFYNLPPHFGHFADIFMGPSNVIDIYGPLVKKNDAKIVINIEHTADTFSVCFDDYVLFNAYMDSSKEWHIVFPAQCRTEPLPEKSEEYQQSKFRDDLDKLVASRPDLKKYFTKYRNQGYNRFDSILKFLESFVSVGE